MPSPTRTLTLTITITILTLTHAHTPGPLDNQHCHTNPTTTPTTSVCSTNPGPLERSQAQHANLSVSQRAQHLIDQGRYADALTLALTHLPSSDREQRDELHFLLGLAEHALGHHDRAAIAFSSVTHTTFASAYNHAINRALDGTNDSDTLLGQLWNDTLQNHHRGRIDRNNPPIDNPALTTAAHLIARARSELHIHNGDYFSALQHADTLRSIDPSTNRRYLEIALEVFTPDLIIAITNQDAPESERDLLLARAYDRASMSEHARSYYQRAHHTARERNDIPTLLEIARHQHNDNQPHHSLHTLQHTHQLDPNHPHTHELLALHHERHGDHDAALEHYLTAERYGARSAALSLRIAVNALAIGDHQLAYARAQEAQAQQEQQQGLEKTALNDTEQHDLHTTLSRAAHHLNRHHEALEHATRAATHPAATPTTTRYAADLHYHHQRFDTALEHYLTLNQQTPTRDITRSTYHTLSQLERHSDAAELLERHLSNDPEHADAWYWLGWAHARNDNPDTAIDAWQRAAELEHADALELVRRLR